MVVLRAAKSVALKMALRMPLRVPSRVVKMVVLRAPKSVVLMMTLGAVESVVVRMKAQSTARGRSQPPRLGHNTRARHPLPRERGLALLFTRTL